MSSQVCKEEMTPNKKRELLWSLMGDLPARDASLKVELVKTEKVEYGTLKTLNFSLDRGKPFSAYFALPDSCHGKKVPAILYNHSHGGRYFAGKEELRSPAPYQYRAWLPDLLQAGYAVFAGDHLAFGSRAENTESEIFKLMLWNGQVMWGRMIYDSVRFIDYLCSRPEVDAERIGTLGMSMGSTMGWFTAALDKRIKVCVDICCLTDYQELIRNRGLDNHGIYYYVPGLLKHFDTASINALIAPRAHFGAEGRFDALTPEVGLDKIDISLKHVYAETGHPERWLMKKYPVKHEETQEMRLDELNFLKAFL